MQNRLAGIKPNCAVRNPMKQRIALFAPAIIHPCHNFLPTISVETIVRAQEM
jgi:hypothetical protein